MPGRHPTPDIPCGDSSFGRSGSPSLPEKICFIREISGFPLSSLALFELIPYGFQIMSATVRPAGMNGNTCSL